MVILESDERNETRVITVESTEAKDLAPAILDLKPSAMVARATEVADLLKDIIERQELFTMISGKKHVKAEGWMALMSMMGINPKEARVIEHTDGSFEAYVELINMKTGMIVGGGSALCGIDEQRWKKADRYARRSMAITRATGKAARLCFAWVMALAGYNTTPAEEMPHEPFDNKQSKPVERKGPEVYTGTNEQKKYLAICFDKHNVVGDDRKRIHEALIENKVEFPDLIEAAVIELHVPIPFG